MSLCRSISHPTKAKIAFFRECAYKTKAKNLENALSYKNFL